MNALIQDLRYAARMLRRNPAFTAVAALTLALGIGMNTAIFSVLHAVLFRPLPYAHAERLVRIDETKGRGGIGVSPPNFVDFQQQNHSFEQIAAYTGGAFVLTGGPEPVRVESLEVSHNLFSLLGVKPLLGRTFSAEEEKPWQKQVAVMAHSLWQRHFAKDPGLVGQNITLDNKSYLVAGIMPPEFEFPIQPNKVELWTPLVLPADRANLRGAHYLDVIGLLKNDTPQSKAHADLELIANRIARQYPEFVSGQMILVPLKQDFVGKVWPLLYMLAGAVTLVLLIATANVASLLLARAAARQKDVAVRIALGASRSRIVGQLLAESVLLALIGGAAGLVLTLWGTEVLVAIGPKDIPRLQATRVDGWVLMFTLITSLLTGILFGLAPALQATRSDLNSVLKIGGASGAAVPRQRLRRILVVSEVALTLVLLCGAGLLVKTLWKLNSVHPGFDPEKVMVAEVVLPKTRYPDGASQSAFFQELLGGIATLAEVESAGGTTNLPLSGTNMVFLTSIEEHPERSAPASFRAVSPGYFRTMRIPLIRGRWFGDGDTQSSPSVVVVNEAMARSFWPGEQPLGKRVTHGFKKGAAEVVGVVGDVKYAGLDREMKPELYAPFSQNPWPFMRLVVRARSDPMRLATAIRSQGQALDKDQPFDKITTMEAIVSTSIAPRRFYMQLLGVFAALALVLAVVGIYGVVSYTVTQRTHEIGIRIALGAVERDVLRLALSEGVKLTLIGMVLGIAGALAATQVLSSLLFEVKPADPMTFLVLSLLLAAAALFATYVPARRAAKVDPMVALRYE